MNPFSNTTNEGSSTAPTTSTYTSRFGSGAEQDRYGAHFGIGSEGFDRLKGVAMAKGIGAEQDRYGSHFTLDHEKVRAAAESILKAKGTGAEQDRHAMHFGLGNDGWERAKRLAAMKGEGAEQDRYGSHFSVDRHTVEMAAQSIQDGAKNVAEKK